MLDGILVHRMIDNVISNALRFASREIKLKAGCKKVCLQFKYMMMGRAFQKNPSAPPQGRFTKKHGNDHFGVGLSICTPVCQKQGGTLSLSNHNGACVEMQIQAEKIDAD